jgi:hypothetical protein
LDYLGIEITAFAADELIWQGCGKSEQIVIARPFDRPVIASNRPAQHLSSSTDGDALPYGPCSRTGTGMHAAILIAILIMMSCETNTTKTQRHEETTGIVAFNIDALAP